MGSVNVQTAEDVTARHYQSAIQSAQRECQRRIESVWPLWAQQNALDGVYGEDAAAQMRAWRDDHRAAYRALTERVDLLDIDVTADEYWPSADT